MMMSKSFIRFIARLLRVEVGFEEDLDEAFLDGIRFGRNTVRNRIQIELDDTALEELDQDFQG
jgi:hypothetical protein